MLARVIQGFVRTLASVLGIVAVVCTSFPLFLVSLPPLAFIYHKVMTCVPTRRVFPSRSLMQMRRYYLATSRELKRLDAVSRSPIFAWFSESLGGLSTIRAFGQQSIFTANIERLVDRNQECYILSISVNRWLAIRLELLGATIIFTASSLALATLGIRGTIDVGLVGLVLSYGLNTTGALNWCATSSRSRSSADPVCGVAGSSDRRAKSSRTLSASSASCTTSTSNPRRPTTSRRTSRRERGLPRAG